jgi:hypothetical protein
MNIPSALNSAVLTEDQRIATLKSYLRGGGVVFPAFTGESNNHIHTIYSFSPYTPVMAALNARLAGLSAAGSVDHDSYAAASEMRRASALLGLDCVTGFEVRASLRHTEFADRKINSPDSKGVVYMTVQGVPAKAAEKVNAFLKPIREARAKRNRKMTAVLNSLLEGTGTDSFEYEKDIVPLSQAAKGGSVTERHILYALALRVIARVGKGEPLLAFLSDTLGLKVSGKNAQYLADAANPFYAYDLLGVLKCSFIDRIYIQPDDEECPKAEKFFAFAKSIDAIPSYAYLGDVTESPTGDKKAEKFEDDFLDALFPRLKDFGFEGVTYMPPRNTMAQLARVHDLCVKYGFMEISGVDINSPRQSFNCPELLRPEFAHLVAATKRLAEHEREADRR